MGEPRLEMVIGTTKITVAPVTILICRVLISVWLTIVSLNQPMLVHFTFDVNVRFASASNHFSRENISVTYYCISVTYYYKVVKQNKWCVPLCFPHFETYIGMRMLILNPLVLWLAHIRNIACSSRL